MIMKNKMIVCMIISFLFGVGCHAQEYLSDFFYEIKGNEKSKVLRNETVATLPFFDDFSTVHTYPDLTKWQSRCVLVNTGFPLYPPNYNAATFDVLDEYGRVYRNGSSTPFIADSLLSVPIRLISESGEKLSPADSLYFSFYYQPQGNGDAPDENDSLILNFGYVIDTFLIEYDTVTVKEILEYMDVDTIFTGDTLYNDTYSGCNLDMFTISQEQYTIADSNVRCLLPCDTLFYSDIRWNHVWSTPGMPLDTFMKNKKDTLYPWFEQVMIPVVDERYFDNDFFILFYNYGSFPTTMYPNDRSNIDQWNVDFVYLNYHRTLNDTIYPLVTFSQQSPSLLKRYQSMPYRQYKGNPTAAIESDYQMYIINWDSIECRTQYTCHIEETSSDWSFDYNSKWCNLSPGHFQDCEGDNATEACPHLNNFLFNMNSNNDSTSYLITHIITVDENTSPVKGDTIYGKQGFYNYYAYDDGIPEKGYGVIPADSYFASQFYVSVPDTLCGVQLLFNRTFNHANYNFFDIVVWNDNNGKPGNEIYRLENQRPVWDDSVMYKFAYYRFDEVVKVNGVIYVGIMQRASKNINIGFDTSIDNSQYNFYEVGDGWKNSDKAGSLMIRPVIGRSYYIGVNEQSMNGEKLCVYPNPANNILHISGLTAESCNDILIFDITGRLMKQVSNHIDIDVSDLSNGLYMIRVVTGDGRCITNKFLIYR